MFETKKIATGLLVVGGLWAIGNASWSPSALAAPGVDFQPSSKIWIEGNSTLHPFKATSKNWQIKATVTPGKAAKIGDITELDVVIPVKSLKSGDGALDNNLYGAMGADKNPNVRFVMKNAKVNVTSSGDIEVDADGLLTIAGKEQSTKISAKGELVGDTVKIKGSKEIKMTDFGVKPPELMFGTIKTDNKIIVKYELVGKVTE
ncbi:YceI-like domain protein [compost metagenome]